jgi:hypothetical protein
VTTYEPKSCRACGGTFQPVRSDQVNCTDPQCKAARRRKWGAGALVPASAAGDEVIEGTIVSPKSRKQWAVIIRRDLRKSAEAIIAAGRHLAEAKSQLDHGEWTPFCVNDLGISPRTAERFMEIAAHPVLANPTHVPHLPPSWGTLYELSRMHPPDLTKAIEAGDVRPDTERGEATRIRKLYAGELPAGPGTGSKPKAKPGLGIFDLMHLLTAFDPRAHALQYGGSARFRELAEAVADWLAEVREVLDELDAADTGEGP